MFRSFVLFAVVLVAALCFDEQSAQAARRFSLSNPYSNFNVHGITYGSMQWEKDHGNRRSVFKSGRRAYLRRW